MMLEQAYLPRIACEVLLSEGAAAQKASNRATAAGAVAVSESGQRRFAVFVR